MKKNFIYMLAVALISMCMVACSSGDDSASNENTTPQKGDTKVILTGRIEKPMTRSTVDDQGNSEWQNGDMIAVRYQKNDNSYDVATATITASGVTWADFTAELTSPKTGDSNVTLVYPYSAYKDSDPYYDYTKLNSQAGTLTDIGTYRNIQSNTATVNVSETTATLKASVLLNTNVCISKFVLKDGNGNAVNADGLIVKEGESATYDVTADAKTNTFYVAMAPFSGNVEIEIKGVKNYPVLSATSSSLPEYGEFIVVKTDDAAHQAYIERSSAENKKLTATGVTLAAGEFYNQNLTVSGYERIAVTAYVGAVDKYCNNFIAIALEDVYSGVKNFSDARALISQDNNWAVQHKLKIDNTTYADEGLKSTNGKYDMVKECAQISETNNHINTEKAVSSQSRTDGIIQGWRLPSVTDIRYIFDAFTYDNSGTPVQVMNTVTPTSPIGIMDHNGMYYSTGSANYFRDASGRDEPQASREYINDLCGNNHMLSQYYWLSSQVIKSNESDPTEGLAWRYSFANEYFIWNSAADNSLARLVFGF